MGLDYLARGVQLCKKKKTSKQIERYHVHFLVDKNKEQAEFMTFLKVREVR
jgi:hypothetical protein